MRQVGGGVLLAVSLIAGTIIGVALGEGSIGFIAGLVVGLLLAALVAFWDSRRQR